MAVELCALDWPADVASFLAAYEKRRGGRTGPQFFLSGAGEDNQIPLPKELYEVLARVVEALAAGQAVTVHPNHPTITTQEAAELLGVSRPTIVKLIEEGRLPAEKLNRHRRIKLRDVLAYKEKRRNDSLDFLARTTDNEQAPSLDEFQCT